jgi:hypothetical protein
MLGGCGSGRNLYPSTKHQAGHQPDVGLWSVCVLLVGLSALVEASVSSPRETVAFAPRNGRAGFLRTLFPVLSLNRLPQDRAQDAADQLGNGLRQLVDGVVLCSSLFRDPQLHARIVTVDMHGLLMLLAVAATTPERVRGVLPAIGVHAKIRRAQAGLGAWLGC